MKFSIIILFTCIVFVSCVTKPTFQTNRTSTSTITKDIDDGYVKNSKQNYTGSASSSAEMPVNTTLDIYLKSLPGVNVSGSGSRATVTVRGISSFNSSNEPLFIVDGVPASSGYAELYSHLNANDIKSVSVLKDASSSAIYGSRAANGVIVITMKKN